MRGSSWMMGTCFAAVLCGAGVSPVLATEKEPETGEVLTDEVQTSDVQTSDVRASDVRARWGVLARGGYFGLPDTIADDLFRQHPKVKGSFFGGEVRYYGDAGRRGFSSLGLAVDSATVEGDGIWQTDEYDSPAAIGGTIKMLSFTVTSYWTAFPSWYVHPYIGLGIGAGYFKGNVSTEDELTEVTVVLPVVHIPLGLAIELGERFQISVETRFLDGITAGGVLQVRF